MAKRRHHVYATVALAGAVAPLGLVHPDALLVSAGALAGLVLTPDLDNTDTPYGWTHRHRGRSHWPVVGTLERAAWFGLPAALAWWATGRAWPDPSGLALLLVGLALADALHWLMDKF